MIGQPICLIDMYMLTEEKKVDQYLSQSLQQFQNQFQQKSPCKSSSKIFTSNDQEKEDNQNINYRPRNSNTTKMMEGESQDQMGFSQQQVRIYYSQEQQEQKVEFKQNYKTKQIAKKPKDSMKIQKKSSEVTKNQYNTKNLLQFFWTKTVNFLNERQEIKHESWWTEIKDKSGSLAMFNTLFQQDDDKRRIIELIFDKKHYFQMIIMSAISKQNKKLYIKYINKLHKGFHYKQIDYLN